MQLDRWTELLKRWRSGDSRAFDELLSFYYRDFHRAAQRVHRRKEKTESLRPTVLLSKLYFRMRQQKSPPTEKGAFLHLADRLMGYIAADHFRKKVRRVLAEREAAANCAPLVSKSKRNATQQALDLALNALKKARPETHRIVLLKFFYPQGQISHIAFQLGLSERKVYRELRFAKAFLRKEINSIKNS